MLTTVLLTLVPAVLEQEPKEGKEEWTAEDLKFDGDFFEDVDGDGALDLIVRADNLIQVVSWKRSRILYTLPMEDRPAFDRTCWPCPDMTGDEFPDILVLARWDHDLSPGYRVEYRLTVHDGRTGETVRAFPGIIGFGIDDLDGDGDFELLAGGDERYSSERARVRGWLGVMDLTSGEWIHRWRDDSERDSYQSSMHVTDDLDDDSVKEVACFTRFNGRFAEGEWVIRSGRTGERLRVIPVGLPDETVWPIPGACSDLDGDGAGDLLISGGRLVLVHSSRDGSIIHRLEEPEEDAGGWGSGFGEVVDCIGDIDGDNIDDLALGLHHYRLGDGALALYSGKTGERLFRLEAPGEHEHFGYGCSSTDIDADGTLDLLVLAYPWQTCSPSRLYMINGKTREVLWSLDWRTVASWPEAGK